MTIKGIKKTVFGWNQKLSNDQIKFVEKLSTQFFLLVTFGQGWVIKFGRVLYNNHGPVNFMLHSAALHIGSSSDTNILWLE